MYRMTTGRLVVRRILIYFFVSALLLVIAFIHPPRMGTEQYHKALWAQNLNNPVIPPEKEYSANIMRVLNRFGITKEMHLDVDIVAVDSHTIPVRTGSTFGYLDSSGKVLYSQKVSYGLLMNESGFINFDADTEQYFISDPYGKPVKIIADDGYPVKFGTGILSISAEGKKIRRISTDGSFDWEFESGEIITSADESSNLIILGTVDGSLHILDENGNTILSRKFKESRIDCIYSACISSDGKYIAVIHGLDGQVLTVLERKLDTFNDIVKLDLDTQLRSPRKMLFSEDSSLLIFSSGSDVVIFDIPQKKQSKLALNGQVEGLRCIGKEGLLYGLYSSAGSDCFFIYNIDGYDFTEFRLNSSDTSLNSEGHSLLIGIDNNVLHILVQRH